jgi:uncharacterized metal-binding protein YceD (DUF177 family)
MAGQEGAGPLKVARLSQAAPTPFEIQPEAAARAALAAELGLLRLPRLRFVGRVAPLAGGGWELAAELGATVVQPCGVTLEPVTTRIDERVLRRFLPDLPEPAAGEAELPEDVDAEPLGATIDPAAVMAEALALALPAFPRAPGAELGEAVFTAPGTAPMRAEDAKPLAGLAALRDRLKDG